MTTTDLAIAAGIAIFVLVFTMAASFPMVAFYATFVEPGHPPEFYSNAALWIAPWSSYILGPIAFSLGTFWCVRKFCISKPILFSVASIVMYFVIDMIILSELLALSHDAIFTRAMLISLQFKLIAAMLGAKIGFFKTCDHSNKTIV